MLEAKVSKKISEQLEMQSIMQFLRKNNVDVELIEKPTIHVLRLAKTIIENEGQSFKQIRAKMIEQYGYNYRKVNYNYKKLRRWDILVLKPSLLDMRSHLLFLKRK